MKYKSRDESSQFHDMPPEMEPSNPCTIGTSSIHQDRITVRKCRKVPIRTSQKSSTYRIDRSWQPQPQKCPDHTSSPRKSGKTPYLVSSPAPRSSTHCSNFLNPSLRSRFFRRPINAAESHLTFGQVDKSKLKRSLPEVVCADIEPLSLHTLAPTASSLPTNQI